MARIELHGAGPLLISTQCCFGDALEGKVMKINLLFAFHLCLCGCSCTLPVSGHTHSRRNIGLCSLMELELFELQPAKLPEVATGTSKWELGIPGKRKPFWEPQLSGCDPQLTFPRHRPCPRVQSCPQTHPQAQHSPTITTPTKRLRRTRRVQYNLCRETGTGTSGREEQPWVSCLTLNHPGRFQHPEQGEQFPMPRVTHRPSTDARDDEQEAASQSQEHHDDDDGADVKPSSLPLLRVEGVDAIKKSHAAPPRACRREVVTVRTLHCPAWMTPACGGSALE